MKKLIVFIGFIIISNFSIAQTKGVIKIALLMPFCGKDLIQNPNHKNAELGNACREYYQGMLIAADTLKKAGYQLEITVTDTERDTIKFKKALLSESVQNADFIIGPVVKEGQIMMQNFKNKKGAMHLSPLFTFTKTKINDPRVISAYPDLNYYGNYLIQYLNKTEATGNLIVLVGKDASDKSLAAYLKQMVKPEFGYKFKQLDLAKHNEIGKLLSTDKDNFIFLASDEETQINAALKSIADTSSYFKISTFGLRKIADFKIVNSSFCLGANLHIITPFFIDYNNTETKNFISTYRNYYETEPNEYAFVGFDQIIMCLNTYYQTNGTFKDLQKVKPVKLLGNKYLIKEKLDASGYQNSYMHILKFTSDGLVEVNW